MDFLDRFFGRAAPGAMAANPALEAPLGLQLLFPAPPALDADALTLAVRGFHPDLTAASVELLAMPLAGGDEPQPVALGLIGWAAHVVKLVAFDAPMPREAVEACVRPAHFDDELKQAAYSHAAHVLLYYAGYHPDPLEQYVALAVVGAALARLGATTVLNEPARSAVPAVALLPHEGDEADAVGTLRSLPLPFLFVGFVKLEVDGQPGVWMRTFGANLLGLPDLALLAAGHHEGSFAFEVFGNVLDYLRRTGRELAAGDTMQVGDDEFLRVRPRTAAEWYLDSEGEMLVCDRITATEANP